MTHARLIALVSLGLSLAPAVARADTFGGFGGREDGYLVNTDRVCTPLLVEGGVAKGTPACKKGSADEVSHLSVKAPKAVRGSDASHEATARGQTLEIRARATDAVVVTWKSADPISKVAALYVSQYGNLLAVEVVVRRGGRDVTDVVAFDLGGRRGTGTDTGTDAGADTGTGTGAGGTTATEPVPEASPAVTKALKAARKAAKGSAAKAKKAWDKVLALDPAHSEALFGLAAAQAKAKKTEAALVALEALAATGRADAIEFLVKARFDKVFARLRAEPRFRQAVGLDRPAATFYERLMGQGGVWEQSGTACETPWVTLSLAGDKTFKLAVKGNCSGDRYEYKFKGTWRDAEPRLVLVMKNKGRPDDEVSCAVEQGGEEDTIRCAVDDDLQFAVSPVRR